MSSDVPGSENAPQWGLRLGLGAVGAVVGGYGLLLMLSTVAIDQYVAVVRWGLAGILLHDAVIAPIEVAAGWVLLRRRHGSIRAIPRAALIGLFSLIVVTLVALGSRPLAQNPTVHAVSPLIGFGIGIAVLVVVAALLYGLARREDHSVCP